MDLGIYSPIVPVLGGLLALLCCWVLCRVSGTPESGERCLPLDGLRGYLALSVFICHGSVWFIYARGGKWLMPTDGLYRQLGLASVSLFFMITGFLFYSRILRDSEGSGTDWIKLYVSRVLRLWPLYLLMLACVYAIAYGVSGWRNVDPPVAVLKNFFLWFGFCAFGSPDINQVEDTLRIVAGAMWTLPYEWYFYLILPILSWLLRARVPTWALLLAAVSILSFALSPINKPAALSFLGGIAGAYCRRNDWLKSFAATPLASAASAAALLFAYCYSDAVPFPFPHLALAAFFCLTASGNTLFGFWTLGPSRKLGELSYSIYLLHGIFLYVTVRVLVGAEKVSSMAPPEHWIMVLSITPVLLGASALTYRFIERPAMLKAGSATVWVKSLSKKRTES